MRLRLGVCFAIVLMGCGLELSGALSTNPDASSSDAASDGAPFEEASAIDGNTSSSSSSGGVLPDGAPLDAEPDVPATGSSVTINVATATNVNLTTDGTIDWVHWGYSGSTGPVRKKDVTPVLSSFTFSGTSVSTGSFENTGWPIKMSWTDGQSPGSGSSSGWYVYFTNSPDAAVTMSAAASTTQRTYSLYVGVGDVNARVEASLDDNSATAFADFDNSVSTAKKVTIAYRATSATVKLIVRYRILMRKNTTNQAAINLAAATLR